MASSSAVKLGRSENEVNLGFGFDDVDFSDRILRLEITPLASDKKPATKRKRKNPRGKCVSSLKVTTLNICSLILAAKSPFFYKLFKNGMRESQKKDEVTLKIKAPEEAGFLDMLNSIYDRPLNATSRAELVDVLMVADKFEVTTCMKLCVELLLNLPNTIESSIFYLELPSNVFMGEITRPLIDSAKKYLAAHFRVFNQSKQEEAMSLPLCAIEVILGSDDLEVNLEDVIFGFILKWARSHYPNLIERRKILTNFLVRFICFGSMSHLKLKEIVSDSFLPDFKYEQISKLVLNAIFSKEQLLDYPRRVYKYRLIEMVTLESVQPRCIVYFNMEKQDCAAMLLGEQIYTESFCLGGRRFSLFALRQTEHSVDYFDLFVEMMGSESESESESCSLMYQISVMEKPLNEFQIQYTTERTLTHSDKVIFRNRLFSWTNLMTNRSEYFIDGILHLRAQLTIIN